MATAEMQRVEEKLDALTTTVSELKANVASLDATVKSEIKTHGGQIGVLFDRQHETASRVGNIERDYVNQNRCSATGEQNRREHEEIRNENRREHEEFRSSIGDLKVSMTKIMALFGAGLTAAQVVINKYWSGN